MTDFEQKVLEELSALKVQMAQLMGVGQPGRVHTLERRVDAHERSMQRMKGLAGAYGGVLALLHTALAMVSGRAH